MTRFLDRRQILASTSAFGLLAATGARAQVAAPAPAQAAARPIPDTNWLNYGNDLGATRYLGVDQINAANFNSLEVAWRFKTDNFGPRKDAYFNCTPLVVKGRLYATVGLERYLVCLDPATGQLLWT